MRGDALGDSLNIRIRALTKLDLGQRRVVASRFSEGTGEQRMAPIGAHPSSQLSIQLAACLRGSSSGRHAAASLELSAANQLTRDSNP